MQRLQVVVGLSWLIVVLALVAAGAGLFWPDGGSPFTFTTLRGDTAQIYRQGLYRYDTLFTGVGFEGQDTITLLLGVPLLVLSLVRYQRGSRRGGLLLMGMLGYFLYVYASMALSAAYNPLFLVYVALFAASLFAFVLAFTSPEREAAFASIAADLPHRAIGVFMLVSGLLTLFVWTEPIVSALLQNRTPARLDSYTTFVTIALDLATITPAAFLSGVLILQRRALGYHIAFPLLVLIVLLAPMIALNTLKQAAAGVVFTTGEMVGPVAGFAILGLIAAWILVVILRSVSTATRLRAAQAQD